MPVKEMTGHRFGRLLVVSRATSDGNGNARWHCQCDCGMKIVTLGCILRSGQSKSCGCWERETKSERFTRHGYAKVGLNDSGLKRAPEYTSWASMKDRCLNERNVRFSHYGGRGITFCERWEKFENFLADMGPRPSRAHSLERKNNDGDYDPKNCIWADTNAQANNKQHQKWVVFNGGKMTLMQAVRLTGVPYTTAAERIKRGWPIDVAISAGPKEMLREFYKR